MLFPALHHWMVSEGGYTGFQAGGAIAIFGASLFLLGAFNNYLVDTFKRKNVCTRSLLLLALLGLLYPYAGEWGMIFLLRVLQGALFGVVLMAMGSTLVIDVTPSQYRNKASVVFTWSGYSVCCAASCWDIMQAGIFLSSSRFIFCGTLCPSGRTGFHGGSLFPCSVGPSVAVVRPFSTFPYLDSGAEHDGSSLHFRGAVQLDFRYFFYICIIAGFIVFLLLDRVVRKQVNGRLLNGVGLVLMCVAVWILGCSTEKKC